MHLFYLFYICDVNAYECVSIYTAMLSSAVIYVVYKTLLMFTLYFLC